MSSLLLSCLSLRERDLPSSPRRSKPGPTASGSPFASASALDWAFLPAHLLDLVVDNLADGTDAAADVRALFAMAGTCAAWRAVALPVLLRKMWRQKKLVHPDQLFMLMPRPQPQPQPSSSSSSKQAPMVRCMLTRHPAISALDGPTYELWQVDNERDPSPRFLLSARMTSSCHFAISLARHGASHGGGAPAAASRRFRLSSSAAAVDMECAELVTNMKRTEYELWACRKQWVTRALGELAGTCGAGSIGSDTAVNDARSAWWRQLLRRAASTTGDFAAAVRDDGDAGEVYCPAGPSGVRQQHPLVQVHYFMRMHGLLLPRRLVVEIAQPSRPTVMATNPLFDPVTSGKQIGYASRASSNDLEGARDQEQDAAEEAGISGPSAAARGTPTAQAAKPGTSVDAPASLRLQNVLPHWSPQLKCWCLNFANRVKLPSIKNFQLGLCRPDAEQQPGHGGAQATARMPVLMQFGKVDTDTFVLDFQPTAMSTLQAFALGLSSFERKYSLY